MVKLNYFSGSVILVDSRFSDKAHASNLSKWLRGSLRVFSDIGGAENSLQEFTSSFMGTDKVDAKDIALDKNSTVCEISQTECLATPTKSNTQKTSQCNSSPSASGLLKWFKSPKQEKDSTTCRTFDSPTPIIESLSSQNKTCSKESMPLTLDESKKENTPLFPANGVVCSTCNHGLVPISHLHSQDTKIYAPSTNLQDTLLSDKPGAMLRILDSRLLHLCNLDPVQLPLQSLNLQPAILNAHYVEQDKAVYQYFVCRICVVKGVKHLQPVAAHVLSLRKDHPSVLAGLQDKLLIVDFSQDTHDTLGHEEPELLQPRKKRFLVQDNNDSHVSLT
jgi:hypothetical protein